MNTDNPNTISCQVPLKYLIKSSESADYRLYIARDPIIPHPVIKKKPIT